MADKYWWPSGGTGTSTGNWNSTTNWSSSSASYVSAAAPTSADTANFGSYSGATAFTVTVTASSVCSDLVINNANMTLAGTGGWTIYGAVTITSFASRTYTGAMTFAATSSVVLNFGSMIFGSQMTFNGVGGTWTLGSALNAGNPIILTNGTLDTSSTGNYSLTATQIALGAGTKTLNLNASTVTLSIPAAISFATNGTNFTFICGTSQINLTTISNPTFAGNGKTFYNVTFTVASMTTATITGANTFNNLTFTSKSASGISIMSFGESQTINGTLTVPAPTTAGSSRYFFRSGTVGTQYTLTANAVSLTDVDFLDIAGAGSATWTGTRLGDCGNNAGITFDTPKTIYWNLAGTQNWSATAWATSSTGTPSDIYFPLAQDTAIFTNNNPATNGNVILNANYNLPAINFSARSLGLVFTVGSSTSIYGSVTLSSAVILSGSGTLTWAHRSGTKTFTSAGKVLAAIPINVSCFGATLQLADAFSTGGSIVHSYGTFDLNGYSCTGYSFTCSNTNTRTLAFGSTGTLTLTGSGQPIFDTSTNTGLTVTGTDPKVYVTYAGVNTTSISTGTTVGISNLFSFYFTAGTYSLTLTAANLFNNLDFTGFAGSLVNTSRSIYGNLKLSAGMTLSAGTLTTTFAATSTGKTITSNGKTMDFPLTFNGVGGSWILQDALTLGATRNLRLTNGTLDLNGFTTTIGTLDVTGGTKNLTFNGATLSIVGSGTTAFNNLFPANFSTTAGTGVGTISMTSASAKTFVGGGSTYNCTLNQGGAGALTITGSNTFNNIANSVQPTTVTFTASLTNTFASFNLNGTAGNLVTINSSTAGTRANIVKTGADVSCDYLNIKDISAA